MVETDTQNIYRKLAQRLDTIPNGFPATESGLELELLAKIFTPEEAALASLMRLTPEPAADIAARAGMDPKTAYRTLKGMARKGQILFKKGKGQLTFGLMPFIFGIAEFQFLRLDAEFAALFERYWQETHGGSVLGETPAIHRVIPVEEAIPFDLEIFPHERAAEMIENAKSWGVRECMCHIQQRLVGKGCDRPTENCLAFAPVEGVFDHSKEMRAITKQDALRILREASEAGLVHTSGNYREEHFYGFNYICNCCTCCCGILRGVAEFGVPSAISNSGFQAAVDDQLCIACGDCVERCRFDALAVPGDVCEVDTVRCVGCGVCVITCPTGALHLERRPESEATLPPADNADWWAQRAETRGIHLDDIL
jgi:electron transport complex protein RnfB